MTYCELEECEEGFRCTHCDRILPYKLRCDLRPCVAQCRSGRGRGSAPTVRSLPFVRERLNICRACEHYASDGGERCGVLVARDKAGLLMHPKGVPNPKAKCPEGRWSEVQSEP